MTTKTISLDLWEKNDVSVTVMQGEINSRFLEITILDNGQAYNLINTNVQFYMMKPDGNVIYDAATITNAASGIITVGLTSEMSAVAGISPNCEIHIIDGNSNEIRVNGLTVIIKKAHSEDSIQSSNEYTALQRMLRYIEMEKGEKGDKGDTGGVNSVNGKSGDVILNSLDIRAIENSNSSVSSSNIQDGAVTQSKINGLTSSISELNILDGVTANADELNVLDGITAATTELNYAAGVTSNIQTQLNSKVDIEAGKGLSTNDFDNTYKQNLQDNTAARHSHSNKSILDETTASYTETEKIKLSGIAENANNYTLPNATSSILGGIKIGSGIAADNNGSLSVSHATNTEIEAETNLYNPIVPSNFRYAFNNCIWRGTQNEYDTLTAEQKNALKLAVIV